MADRTIAVRLEAITQQYEAKMRAASATTRAFGAQLAGSQEKFRALGGQMQSAGAGMSRLGGSVTRGVTLPLGIASVAAIKLASDAEETENKVRVTFGKMADSIIDWSSTSIDKMGLARQTSQDMATEFGLLFQAAKLPGSAVIGLSQDFTQLSADMASFFNVDTRQAMDALRSGLVGESEPLRRFGVLLSESAVKADAMRLGLAKAGQELTEQQKIVARSSIIQESLNKAQGDFARTSDSAANQQRKLIESFKEMGAELGQDLLPIAQDVLKSVQDLVHWFHDLPPGVQANIVKFALLGAALGPVLKLTGGIVGISGKLVSMMGNLGTSAGTAATGVGGLNKNLGSLGGMIGKGGLVLGGLIILEEWWRSNAQEAAEFKQKVEELTQVLLGDSEAAAAHVAELQELIGALDEAGGMFSELAQKGRDEYAAAQVAAAEEVRKHVRAVELLQGGLSKTQRALVDSLIASGNYATALRAVTEWEETARQKLIQRGERLEANTHETERLMFATLRYQDALKTEAERHKEVIADLEKQDQKMLGLIDTIKTLEHHTPVVNKFETPGLAEALRNASDFAAQLRILADIPGFRMNVAFTAPQAGDGFGMLGGGLVGIGSGLQGRGFLVGEHPAFGGVQGEHVSGSYHYAGRAIDVNWPGPGEVPILNALGGTLRATVSGIKELFYPAYDPVGGHDSHLHLAMAMGGIITGPTRALLGERGPEAVIPLSGAGSYTAMADLARMMAASGGSAGPVYNFQFNGPTYGFDDFERKVTDALGRAASRKAAR